MTIRFRVCGFLAALCLLAAWQFAGADEKSDRDKDNAKPLTDQEFIAQALEMNLGEVNTSQLAIKMASNDDVKKFAKQMVEDHDKLGKKLLDLANSKRVVVPTGIPVQQAQRMQTLTRLTGKDFDRQYMDMMVRDHEQAVKMCERCEKSKDENVSKLCKDTLGELRDHLKEARAIQEKLTGKSDKDKDRDRK
jgi:putative membrane protein